MLLLWAKNMLGSEFIKKEIEFEGKFMFMQIVNDFQITIGYRSVLVEAFPQPKNNGTFEVTSLILFCSVMLYVMLHT